MTTVYADSVFFLNGAMDYLICLGTARLAGIPLRRRRYLAAALAGGVYAVAVFLPGCAFLTALPVKLAAGVLLALIAFGGEERLPRLTLLMFGLACGMAGCVLALGLLSGTAVPVMRGIFYTDVDARVLLLAAGGAYTVLSVVFRAAARNGLQGELLETTVCLDGRTAEFTALWDSGNGLRDLAGGCPVLVVAPRALDGVLPGVLCGMLTAERLRDPAGLMGPVLREAPNLRPRLLPYHAVGRESGLLLTVQTDWTEIQGTRYPGMRAAISPTALGNGYSALWGGEVRKERGKVVQTHLAQDPGRSGADTVGPLYRRQRHASSAADKGAGSGIAEPDRRGRRPAGADRT